ncbi:MAG: hypothetical protein HYX41_04630 [Bdellovibrio sp.]|nr:hypothetical protein [Bdellovibrio sp.]
MRSRLLLICLFVGWFLTRSASANMLDGPPIVLSQGEQKILTIPDLRRFSIGSPILRATPPPQFKRDPGKNLLMIKGVSPGLTDLVVWKDDGTVEKRSVQVLKGGRDELSPALLRSLSRLNEVEILFTGKGAVLRGEVQSHKEAEILNGITKSFPDLIHDETEINEELLHQATADLRKWIDTSQLGGRLTLGQTGAQLWIRGTASSPSDKQSLIRKAKAIFGGVQVELDTLPDHAPTVYFRVFLLELKRNHFQTLGLSWPLGIPDAVQITSGSIQDLMQIHLAIQSLEGTGHARILSKPEVVVRAPGEAELFVGGELPIQIQNRYFSNVSWKNYGLTLKLKVSHVTGEKIRLDIFTELSHLDPQISQSQVPGFQSNRMKTQVDATFGAPLLLSGLLQQKVREEVKGLPILKNIPVLGALFGSTDYLNEQSELVAILYPGLAPPPVKIGHRFNTVGSEKIPAPRNWKNPTVKTKPGESENYPWNLLE